MRIWIKNNELLIHPYLHFLTLKSLSTCIYLCMCLLMNASVLERKAHGCHLHCRPQLPPSCSRLRTTCCHQRFNMCYQNRLSLFSFYWKFSVYRETERFICCITSCPLLSESKMLKTNKHDDVLLNKQKHRRSTIKSAHLGQSLTLKLLKGCCVVGCTANTMNNQVLMSQVDQVTSTHHAHSRGHDARTVQLIVLCGHTAAFYLQWLVVRFQTFEFYPQKQKNM